MRRTRFYFFNHKQQPLTISRCRFRYFVLKGIVDPKNKRHVSLWNLSDLNLWALPGLKQKVVGFFSIDSYVNFERTFLEGALKSYFSLPRSHFLTLTNQKVICAFGKVWGFSRFLYFRDRAYCFWTIARCSRASLECRCLFNSGSSV